MTRTDAAREKDEITALAGRLCAAKTTGELGGMLAECMDMYPLTDLQILGGKLYTEVESLPEPYRARVRPHFTEQIFGAHHRLLLMHRSGAFQEMTGPISDRETFSKFWAMVPEGCFAWDEQAERTPFAYAPKHRLFYYLMAAFTMFVLEKPGHPVGMPFPGGFSVEDRGGTYYCLIRDREKEVYFSICNFCPAKQAEEKDSPAK